MRFIYFLSAFIISLALASCRPSKNAFHNNLTRNDFTRYLEGIANDTNSFELPALEITNDGILPILDSVISYAENCKYFDNRIKYQHAFLMTSRVLSNGLVEYRISAHQSIQDVIGITANKLIRGVNSPANVGVFYYKNYLFSSVFSKGQWDNSVMYPFLSKTSCTHRIHATKLFNENNYSSYINFVIDDHQYRIIENEICGHIILIE